MSQRPVRRRVGDAVKCNAADTDGDSNKCDDDGVAIDRETTSPRS
jgi:hypothetical protein